MKVWRVEHKDTCEGPWQRRETERNGRHGLDVYMAASKDRPGEHPCPFQAGGSLERVFTNDVRRAKDLFIFACVSLDQLLLWFKSAKGRAAMSRAGYVIRVYKVDGRGVLSGQMQVAFRKDKADLLQEVKL